MPRRIKPTGKVASVPDRIRGAIVAVLTIACYAAGANTTDSQLQVTFVIAGTLYFMTTLAMMFKDVDRFDT